jgi:hypothetical protein
MEGKEEGVLAPDVRKAKHQYKSDKQNDKQDVGVCVKRPEPG